MPRNQGKTLPGSESPSHCRGPTGLKNPCFGIPTLVVKGLTASKDVKNGWLETCPTTLPARPFSSHVVSRLVTVLKQEHLAGHALGLPQPVPPVHFIPGLVSDAPQV